jgi:hypothetical protein
MSAVNHQFPLAVRLAETFASASRTLSGWVRVSSRSPTPNRSRERGRSPGKPPLSDDDRWPLCANSGHSPTAERMGQLDPKHAFPRWACTGGARQKVAVGANGGTRQKRPFLNQLRLSDPLGTSRWSFETSTPMVSFCIFSAPLLVIRGSPPGIRSGQRKRRGPIQLSRDPSNGPRVPDPTLATVERTATLSQRSLLASAARKVIRQAGIARTSSRPDG